MVQFGELMLDGFIFGADLAIGATFLAVFQKLRTTRSAAGLSLQTLVAIVTARCLHLLSHPLALHYSPTVLPKELFCLLDGVNALMGVACLFIFGTYYYSTYEVDKDNFGIQIFDAFDCLPKSGPLQHRPIAAASFLYFLVAVAALVWYCVRAGSLSFASGYFCCFYEAMSAVALIPQLWMFNKDKRVPSLLATFVVLVAVGRVCTLAFWWSYTLVHPWRSPANRGIQMSFETLNLLILSDFLYYWGRSKWLGQKDVVLGDSCDCHV